MDAEDRIIQRILGLVPPPSPLVRVPPGDDGAVLSDGTVLTTDALVEGVHFDGRSSGADVGFKAVAVNVSDVAAMGARPTWMLLTLSVPGDDAWLADFAVGLAEAAERWGVMLVGGDTTSTPGPRTIGVQMAGALAGRPLLRRGGQPGDRILITGTPGLAAAGYLHANPAPEALRALRRPLPDPELAAALAPIATAGMDLSDGLRADLPRLCRASGVGAVIDPGALPDHPALHGPDLPARTLQLAGGDDYDLLITVPPDQVVRSQAIARDLGHRITDIGRLTSSSQVLLTDGPWPPAPWAHFPGESR